MLFVINKTVYDHVQKRVDTQRAVENLELLKQWEVFPGCPSLLLSKIAAACREVKLKKDHVIIQQNHLMSHVYCIAQGQCQEIHEPEVVYGNSVREGLSLNVSHIQQGFSGETLPGAQTLRGRSLLVAEYGQHQVLGLLPVLTEQPPPSSMVCSTDCTLLAISAMSLSEILEADQQYLQRLIQLGQHQNDAHKQRLQRTMVMQQTMGYIGPSTVFDSEDSKPGFVDSAAEGSGNEVKYDEEEEEEQQQRMRTCYTKEQLRAEVGLTKTVHLGGCTVHPVQHCKEEKELDMARVKVAHDLDHLADLAQVHTDPRTENILSIEVPVVMPCPPSPPHMAAQRRIPPPSTHRSLISAGNTGGPLPSAEDPHRRPSVNQPSDFANPTSRTLPAPIVPSLKLPARGGITKEDSLSGTMSARASTIEPWISHSRGASTSRSRTIERSTRDTMVPRRSKELRLREEPNGRIVIPRFNHVSNFKRRHLPGEALQQDLHIKLPSKDSTRECGTPLDGGPLHPLYGPEVIPTERSFSSPAPPLLGVDLKCTRRGATLPILIDNGKHGPQHRAKKKSTSVTATLRKMPKPIPAPPIVPSEISRRLYTPPTLRPPPEKYASWMDRQQNAKQKGEEDTYGIRDGIQIGLYNGGFNSKSCEFEGGFYNEGTMYF